MFYLLLFLVRKCCLKSNNFLDFIKVYKFFFSIILNKIFILFSTVNYIRDKYLDLEVFKQTLNYNWFIDYFKRNNKNIQVLRATLRFFYFFFKYFKLFKNYFKKNFKLKIICQYGKKIVFFEI
jgi:hypothetical protein